MRRRTLMVAMTVVLVGNSATTWAGQVLISDVNVGSTARVYWFDGIGVNGTQTQDVNSDGDMSDIGEIVTVPNQDSVVEITVCKDSGFDNNNDGITSWKVHKLEPTTLALAEPFSTPTFRSVPTDPGKKVAPVIDVSALIQSGITFQSGQVHTVTNGIIAATGTILFKDATGVPEANIPQLFDPVFLNSLPNYNGNVTVSGPDQFQVIPVPTVNTWGLVWTALLMMIGASMILRRSVSFRLGATT